MEGEDLMLFEFRLCFLADNVILLVSSSHDLQLVLGLFAAKWFGFELANLRH